MNQKRNTDRPSEKFGGGKRDGKSKTASGRNSGGFDRSKKYSKPDSAKGSPFDKSDHKKDAERPKPDTKKSYAGSDPKKSYNKPKFGGGKPTNRPFYKGKYKGKENQEDKPDAIQGVRSTVRLNKYLADAGICSRREADRLIGSGVVEINGKIITELGTKVGPDDKVRYGGETLKREKLQYVLLNKPKGFISTSDDPMDRKTVMLLVENACKERIYSVGRLDRNTTGLLLFTNDGDMAKRLTHPKHGVRKLYHAVLDKPLTRNDMLQILQGVKLEDGTIRPDKIEWVEGVSAKNEVGIELHSGKNRIVRRIFEHLGYHVDRLDRVVFAGLTKKDIPRGKWRILNEKEINMLKMI